MFAHSLRSFAPRLLTHFVRSLHFRSLTSFVRCTFAHSLRSFALGARFARAFVAHFIRFSLAHSLRSFARALPPYDLLFRFALYNLSGRGCPLESPIACTITFYNSLVPSLFPFRSYHRSFQFACPIALFQKIFP